VDVVASLSQSRTAAAQCGLFTHKSVPVIFEPPCIIIYITNVIITLPIKKKCCVLFPLRVSGNCFLLTFLYSFFTHLLNVMQKEG